MRYGYIKTAAVSPALRLADPDANARAIIEAMRECHARGVRVLALPELCLCGYTCGDLFLQDTLLSGCEAAMQTILSETAALDIVTFVGVPVRLHDALYNCAAVLCRGQLMALVPKTFLPNYAEFYELRHFTPAPTENTVCTYAGCTVPFGTRLLFPLSGMPDCVLAAELCEDLWAPNPPSVSHALAGANVIINLSASDETVGKADYRRQLVSMQSARLSCAYLYADAATGESTTDMVFAAHNLIAENGSLLAESKPFGDGCAETEVDVQLLSYERRRSNTFRHDETGYTRVILPVDAISTPLTRTFDRLPFIPQDASARAQRCEDILNMQAQGLARRISHAWAKTAVVGISGGLDSCLALLVSVRAMALLGRPASDVIAVTMPCFGTTKRTRSNAEILVQKLGATFRCINLSKTTLSHFEDISHDYDNHDVTFENAQARGRTYILMDLANQTGGLVVGTGDLSELALGWATYNGDHMSMYGVNASVPKTLIRYIVGHCADKADDPELAGVLRDILATPVSPELLPTEEGRMTQITEDIVGPYELHDFILFYAIRRGFSPAKVYLLLQRAFGSDYSAETLKKWLVNFYRRFFVQQFKRSCLPDGPKVGSVALSPRGDWRMPSDAAAALWRSEAESL